MLVAGGLLGIRYSIISSKYHVVSILFFLCGMSMYVMATLDQDNHAMMSAGILVGVAYLLATGPLGYALFMGSWLWYSMYMNDVICVLATFFLALECCLSRAKVDTPIIYISLVSVLLLSERSSKGK